MDFDHKSKIVNRHLGEGLIAEDTRVVDQDVDTPPFVHGLLDHVFYLRVVSDVCAVANCLTTRCFDFRDYGFCIGGPAALIAEIIYEDFCPAFRKCQRVAPAQTLASSRDDGHLAV
jgi:hypothetical protein